MVVVTGGENPDLVAPPASGYYADST